MPQSPHLDNWGYYLPPVLVVRTWWSNTSKSTHSTIWHIISSVSLLWMFTYYIFLCLYCVKTPARFKMNKKKTLPNYPHRLPFPELEIGKTSWKGTQASSINVRVVPICWQFHIPITSTKKKANLFTDTKIPCFCRVLFSTFADAGFRKWMLLVRETYMRHTTPGEDGICWRNIKYDH